MAQPLVIIGAGGHGREVLDIVLAAGGHDFLGFLDDGDGPFPEIERRGERVLGPVERLADLDASYLIGIADPGVRQALDALVAPWERPAATAVHPDATVGSELAAAPGMVVWAGARISTNVRMGRHVHVNLNASVSHDCRLGDYVTITPGVTLSGTVHLGDLVYMGAGSSTVHSISIGEGTTVGAGATVIGDLPAGVVAVGVPARPLRR